MKKRIAYILLSAVMLLNFVNVIGVASANNSIDARNRGIAWPRIFSASAGTLDWAAGFNHIAGGVFVDFDVTVPGQHTMTLPPWPRNDTMWIADNTGVMFLNPTNPTSAALPVTVESIAINGEPKITNQRFTPSQHGFWNETAGTYFGNITLAGNAQIGSIPNYEILGFQVPVAPGGPSGGEWLTAGANEALGAIKQGDIITVTFLVGTPPESAPRDLPTRPADPKLSDFPAGTKFIALTFDDGPNTNYTVQVLDELKRLGATATFYVNPAKFNDATLDVVYRMISEGHDVDNHGWAHTSFGADILGNGITFTTQAQAIADLTKASQDIFNATGYWPFSFRAPFFEWGGTNNILLGLDRQLNMAFFDSGMDTNDWRDDRTPQAIANVILNNAEPSGGVVLLHDCGGVRQRTVDSLALFIPEMKERGYEFVSVRQLMLLTGNTPELFTGNGMWPRANQWVPSRGTASTPLWAANSNWQTQNWWTDPIPPWERAATGPLTTADALLVLRAATGLVTLSQPQMERYNITDTPTTALALQILRVATGLPPT
jgi:peptidoglycan/xylan/chitin deacetylase (PgdA/CDA1 family)